MKYRPDFPKRFGSLADARAWTRVFFPWYNHEHYHSGIALMTPAQVHYGQADAVRSQRQQVLDVAYAAHPERFVRGPSRVAELPEAVWINAPAQEREKEQPSTAETDIVIAEAVDPVLKPEDNGAVPTS